MNSIKIKKEGEAMYTIKLRVYNKDKELIGYQVSDGKDSKDISIEEALELAEKSLIKNASEKNGKLIGKGCDLRKIEKINRGLNYYDKEVIDILNNERL